MAACDKGLEGKKISHGEIEFEVRKEFYKGKEVSEKELAGLLRENGNVNLVGEKCVNVAVKEGLISSDSIIRLNDVPHAQLFKI